MYKKPLDHKEKLLNTPAASAKGPIVSLEYAWVDGEEKTLGRDDDLSDIYEEA